MEKLSLPTRCDCLQGSKTTDVPPSVAHVDEQVSQIDHHIRELFELRSTFLSCSNQLRSPFYVIPPEIMSHIFQEVVRVRPDRSFGLHMRHSFADPQQAFVLSSVSRCFRQVALGTPELWNKLEFELYSIERAINGYAPLLQHCVSHISNLYLGIKLHYELGASKDDDRLMTQVILSPDITPKVNHLVLHSASDWILSTLHSLPVLDTLEINEILGAVDMDLEALPLSRVSLSHPRLESIALPPSIEVLELNIVSGDIVITTLQKQCPNFVLCSSVCEQEVELRRCSTLRHPLTLHHLKQLTWFSNWDLQTIRNLRLPSLERLQLRSLHRSSGIDMAIVSLCREASTSLISLDLGGSTDFGDDGLWQICRLRFPRLKELKFIFWDNRPLFDVIETLLSQAEDDNHTSKVKYMPNLRSLHLRLFYFSTDPPKRLPHLLIELLKQKRYGETSHFHLDFDVRPRSSSSKEELWSPELQEELKLTIHGRDLKLTRNGRRIEWLQ